MAVLVEAISVIVRMETISERCIGGWPAFEAKIPNQNFCTEHELARIGFMTPTDVQIYLRDLEDHGLVFLKNDNAVDLAVIDQLRKPTTPCNCVDFGRLNWGKSGHTVAASWLHGSECGQIATPDGWTYEGSISASHTFVPSADENERMQYLPEENGVEVYLDLQTGGEVFIGRTQNVQDHSSDPNHGSPDV